MERSRKMTSLLLKYKRHLLAFFLLSTTPVFWTIVLGAPSIRDLAVMIPKEYTLLSFINSTFSYNYLFFENSPGLYWAVGEHGFFLTSFVFPVVLGLWYVVVSPSKKIKLLLYLFGLALILSFVSSRYFGIIAYFWYLPVIFAFGFIGFEVIILNIKTNSSRTFVKLLSYLFVCLYLYETLRLFRVIEMLRNFQG